MAVVVTDTGFHPDTDTPDFLDVASDTCPKSVALDADAIRIDFPNFSDGRGFTIARVLRARGYKGRLRARGHLIADQYAMARRVGFDEVEIPDALAARQPEASWLARADWRDHDPRSRLRALQ